MKISVIEKWNVFLQENNAGKWFCELSLGEKSPDHSYFGDFRKRLGTTRLMAIFTQVRDSLKTVFLARKTNSIDSHWFSKFFATFAKKRFHSAIKDSRDPYLQILPSRLVRRFPGWNPRTQMRSYSEPLVPKLLKEAFIWGWDPGSTHLQQKRGPNPGHARDRFFTFC